MKSTIVSEGFKGGTRGSPIMPRDVSLSDSKCWNSGQKGLINLILSRETEGERLHTWRMIHFEVRLSYLNLGLKALMVGILQLNDTQAPEKMV